MDPTFSRDHCTVCEVTRHGRATGGKTPSCLVQVTGQALVIIGPGPMPLLGVRTTELEVATPPLLRRIGTVVAVRTGGQLVAVAFDTVYAGELRAAGRGVNPFTAVRSGMRLGRELAREFAATLVAAGALDATS